MTPIPSARATRDRKIGSILGFAVDLTDRLQSNPPESSLLLDLQYQIDQLGLLGPGLRTLRTDELDSRGTTLWNLSTRLKREENADVLGKTICLVRVFAFLLLDCAERRPEGGLRNSVRLIKVALKTARHCLEQKEIDLKTILRVLERAAQYEAEISVHVEQASSEDRLRYKQLSAEYFAVRILLAWRQSRLDLAEHMYSKASSYLEEVDPSTAEDVADLLYEIGRDLLNKREHEMAVKWLERCYDALCSQSLERLSRDASDLRLSALHDLVKALLGRKDEAATARARDILDILENDYGDKLVVHVLKLALLEGQSTSSTTTEFFIVLQRMIRTVLLSEVNFKLIMRHIHNLHLRSSELACKALDEFLCNRLYSAEHQEWVEKAFITRLWMGTSDSDSAASVDEVRSIVGSLSGNLQKPLDSAATHAAQILLWKRIESCFVQGLYDAAQSWCRLAMHDVFANSGELNHAKIARKMMLCALAGQDPGSARDIYNQMSSDAKAAPLTQYLMFKAALRGGDQETAAKCLDAVGQSSNDAATLLYACVLEAQETADKVIAAAALQKVLERCEHQVPEGVHVPALLRCSSRLLLSKVEKDHEMDEGTIEDLCGSFERAAKVAMKLKREQQAEALEVFSVSELNWFSRNTYNLSLKVCASWKPRYTLRLLRCCIQFIDQYPELDGEPVHDLDSRRLHCDFLCVSLLIVEARAEDSIEAQLQFYLSARKHAAQFRKRWQRQFERQRRPQDGSSQDDDLVKKYATLVAFDFEAASRLKDWDALGSMIDECGVCNDARVYGVLADVILSCQAPEGTTIVILRKIVSASARLEKMDTTKLSRWIRCLLQMALPRDVAVAEEILGRVGAICRDLKVKRLKLSSTTFSQSPHHQQQHHSSYHYPPEELEWLATTTFNRAIDFYCASDDVRCKLWAEKALAIAAIFDDETRHQAQQRRQGGNVAGGPDAADRQERGCAKSLRDLLEEKYLGLNWGDEH